jgi:hypothetical protein
MFSTILSYINNMLAVLRRGFGAPQAMARLSMREALQEAATRLTKTKSEYTELADTTEPEAAPFEGSPAQPISLGVFGSYDLRVNKLIEDQRLEDARQFANENASILAASSMAGYMKKTLGEMSKQARMIKASPKLTTEQKDAALENLYVNQLAMSRNFLKNAERTTLR